ncbi:hypothetical protein ADK97_17810 [Streptomyces sp. H021]|nr:hypothetical protein ADK97_17810 [Streptomyces sp. H021]
MGGKGGRLAAEGSEGLQPNHLPRRHWSGPGTPVSYHPVSTWEFPMPTAITFSEYGSSGVLRPTEVAPPQPGPGQVRIEVRAASVNPLDTKIRSGLMAEVSPARFPVIPGLDAAGVVDAVGEGAGAAGGDDILGAADARRTTRRPTTPETHGPEPEGGVPGLGARDLSASAYLKVTSEQE